MFVLGCDRLIVSTDHKPLLGILGDRELGNISNPRLLNLKQKTLAFRFKVQYSPGKWHRGADAMSRNPVPSVASIDYDELPDLLEVIRIDEAPVEDDISDEVSMIAALESKSSVKLSDIHAAAASDEVHRLLSKTILAGFPSTRHATDPQLRDFWSVRDRLSVHNGIILMGDRLVIPKSVKQRIINGLHAAHQGVSSMMSRARQSVYWPGMDTDIRSKRYSCHRCNEIAPSQSNEPLVLSPTPDYPFQMICADYFEIALHAYLSIADRFTGWIIVYHFPEHARSEQLIKTCRKIFEAYGIAEEISSDGGPQFIANRFKMFLEDWGVKHRLSSAFYPQSNGRAENGVKVAKRIVYDNTSRDGSLDNDKAARAILQYRNTPMKDIGLSPAQMLLHRQLRDHIPVNPKLYKPNRSWIISAMDREHAIERRNANDTTRYNSTAHDLPPLVPRTPVTIQTKRKWDRSGVVVEVLPNRQYRIKVDGSGRVVLRNRRFLKPAISRKRVMIPSASVGAQPALVSPESSVVAEPLAINEPPAALNPTAAGPAEDAELDVPPERDDAESVKQLPKAMRGLADHNKRGERETDCLTSSRLRVRRK